MTTTEITPQSLVELMRVHSNRAKTVYRPLICPFHVLLGQIPKRARVLDIGCGGGAWLSMIAHHREPLTLDGFDVDAGAVEAARQLFEKMKPACPWAVTVGDLDAYAPRLGEYDVVTMVDVLHHLPPDAQVRTFVTLGRSLRPGALLILKDIDGASPLVIFNKIHDLLSAGEIGKEKSFSAALHDLVGTGFEIVDSVRQRMLWYPHYTIVARRK